MIKIKTLYKSSPLEIAAIFGTKDIGLGVEFMRIPRRDHSSVLNLMLGPLRLCVWIGYDKVREYERKTKETKGAAV